MKKFATISTILLLSLILVAPASALRSSVYFLGQAEKFVFHPGSDWSDTDLFDGFKNAMPGDKLTESISVRNAAGDCDAAFRRAGPSVVAVKTESGGHNPLSGE